MARWRHDKRPNSAPRSICSAVGAVLAITLALVLPGGPLMAEQTSKEALPTQQQVADCKADAGQWVRAGLRNALVCIRPTADGGAACSASEQCVGLCLAKSGTCAAETPMFGCIPILENGQEIVICVD